jgi:diguanylate cyclase (GGDEF)-like protein
MATSSRNGKPLGLIIFDLDHFKRINDRFGHDAGDNVLVQLANVVRRTTRRNDRFFRLGGEEFALLIPDTSPESLRDIAEKVRLAVQREVHCGDAAITASLGASILRIGESAGSWQARADAAMYRAKHGGRNRSVIDEIDPPDQPVAICAAMAPTAHASAGKPTRIRKGADARSTVAPLHAQAPRSSGPRRSHKAALMDDSSLPASLASLAGNEDRVLRASSLAASALTTLP